MYKKLLILMSSIILSLTSIVIFKQNVNDKASNYTYTLKSYRNCLALYKNEEIIEIYDNIILNNLPPKDKEILLNGISFNNISDVDTALQDYDG